MQYQGSKKQLSKHILPIILKDRQEGQWYVEPFCGGCNTLSEVTGLRIGADSHDYLIEMWEAVSKGWIPPKAISVDEYTYLKSESKKPWCSCIPNRELIGYVGFVFSWRNKWFGGYGNKLYIDNRNGKTYYHAANYWKANYKQFSKLRDVIFKRCNYEHLKIPNNSIIYCDPPYEGTIGYVSPFDSVKFWGWVRVMSSIGHKVFVSEYSAPDDFICIWEKEMRPSNFNCKQNNSIEKLFVHRSQIE